jgi:16S rRNA (cytosine1402-N4)-methyltransferase
MEIRDMRNETEDFHQPVLLDESVEALHIREDGVYVDATFGGGGHSRAILKKLKSGKLFAFDQDQEAEKNAGRDDKMIFINQNFRYLRKMLRAHGTTQVDGILADLGVSSHQLNMMHRGFAHRLKGKLDMRMDMNGDKTAADILSSYDGRALQNLFSEYGEVRNAKTLAARIVERRKQNRFDAAEEFITAIQSCIRGNRNRYLSQVFQALRIEVNDEMGALKEFLAQSLEVLKQGGRMVVISYHSLEDRKVKNFMRSGSVEEEQEQKDFLVRQESAFTVLTKKPITASDEEIGGNPRARSARLRIAVRN